MEEGLTVVKVGLGHVDPGLELGDNQTDYGQSECEGKDIAPEEPSGEKVDVISRNAIMFQVPH